MNLSNRGLLNNKDMKLNAPSKVTTLNPNAAEFIPSAFRSPLENAKSSETTSLDAPGASVKSVFDRSESSVSNKSDDEAHRYWRDQLPDDITPDFKSMGEDELQTPGQLSLATLSLYDGVETSRLLTLGSSQLFATEQDTSHDIGNLNFGEKVRYLGSSFMEDQSSNAFTSLAATEWDKKFMNGDQQFTSRTDGDHYNGDSSVGLFNDSFSERSVLEDGAINPVDFLASLFPGFAAESLADVYYANGCDMHLTIEILTQLELQVDANFSRNTNPKSSEPPSFNMLDFPALPAADSNNGASKFNGEGLHQASNTYRPPSTVSSRAVDFAATVKKLASQDSSRRKYERSSSADGIVGSSGRSQLSNTSYNGDSKLAYGDKVRNSAAGRAVPLWLETGDAVANMYSDLREDARDFARLRNACFEQARQAYLIGNGALARELSRKGHLYNMQMKAAHGKAKENIYRQRNSVLDARMQNRLIDLHGLHVTEAIQILQHELSIVRGAARSAGERLQVLICVGTGHHTKGSRTPARLPVAIEQFLLEEGFHFTQPQPGLLRVVVY